MKIILRLALVAFAALPILAQGPQPKLGVVRGVVIRAGTGDPVAGVSLTLSVEPPASLLDSLKSFASSMGIPPGQVQGVIVELMTATPEFLAREIEGGKADGRAPASFLALLSQALALKTETKGFPLRTLSDSNGQFIFSGVPAGVFTLLARHDGYFGAAPNAVAPLPEDVSLPVTVRDLQTTVTVSMIPGAVISGRLLGVDGSAAPNVPVHALNMAYPSGIPIPVSVRSARTDDTGQFRLFWLPPGQYFLAATPAVSTGAFATFYSGGIELTTASLINVAAGQEVFNQDFGLQTGRTVTVSGEVTESGGIPNPFLPDGSPAPPRSLRVWLIRQPPIVGSAPTGGSPPIPGSAAIEGTFPIIDGRKTAFELRGVPPGNYYLHANTAANSRSTTSFEVRDKDVTGVQIDVRMGVTVTGVVTIDGIAPPGNAAARIALLAFDPDGKTVFEETAMRTGVPIAPDGKFSMPNNPWGRHTVRTIGMPPETYVDEILQGGLNVFDSGVNVTSDAFRYATDQIMVRVKSNGGRIEGTVQSVDRKPSSGAVVVLVPPVARRRNPSLYRSATSDSEGRFSLHGIQPGEYKVFAWESVPDGAWQNAEFLAGYETQGRAVSIAPSATTKVEIVAAR